MKETRRLNRAQFLRLTGAGLAGSAFLAAQPYEWAIAQETTLPQIKLGAFVGWDRNYPATDNSTTLSRWSKWASSELGQGKIPHMFCDWFALNAAVDQIRNIDNKAIIAPDPDYRDPQHNNEPSLYDQVRTQVGAKSFMLSFNIRPKQGQDMLDIYNGARAASGFTADEHVVMIGDRLAQFCNRSSDTFYEQLARVRYLHEFTAPRYPWSAFDENGSAKRFTTGHYRQLYRRWQRILAGGPLGSIDDMLRDDTEPGDPAQPKLAETIDARRLKRAGYPQFGNGELKTNTKFGTVWCGQAGKDPSPTEDPTDPAANDFRNYYPGDHYVYEVGCDMYVGGSQKAIDDKFISLGDFYTKAQTHGKPFAIPEWSIIKDDSLSDEQKQVLYPTWVDMIAKWMEGRTLFACNYEVLQQDVDWRLGNGEEPEALARWREHVTGPNTSAYYLGSEDV